jgi:outer membrane receptor for Fe3+-dicitrate
LQQELQGSFFDSWAHAFDEDRDTDQTIPAVTINWTPADDHLLYASYTEGFKSGGFQRCGRPESDTRIVTSMPASELAGLYRQEHTRHRL